MKTFIVGGTGFLGYYTCLELLRRGHEVSTLAHMPPPDELDFPKEVKLDIADMNKISDDALLAHLQGADGSSSPLGWTTVWCPKRRLILSFTLAMYAPPSASCAWQSRLA